MNWNESKTREFDDVLSLYDSADAETSAGAIPSGKYPARLVDGHLDRARTGTACFCIKWEIVDGEFQGRHLISRHWMTAKSVSRTKGDLLELGINGAHLRGAASLPLVTAEISVVHKSDEAGDLYQEIRRIKRIVDVASVNGHDGDNGAGADTVQAHEANTAHGAVVSLPDDGAAPSGDDEIMDGEYIDFSGKE